MVLYRELNDFEKRQFNDLEDHYLKMSGKVKKLLFEKYEEDIFL